MVNYGIHVRNVDILKDIKIYIYIYMIKNIFLSLALSSIGFGCYIYFNNLNKIKSLEKIEELNKEISDEEDFKTPIILNETTSNESYESC